MNKFTHNTQEYWSEIFHTAPPIQAWRNPLNSTSLRLSISGFKLVQHKFKHYEIKINNKITPRVLLLLEKGLKVPYYIKDLTNIFVFDQDVAVLLTLYSGDLESYLINNINYG